MAADASPRRDELVGGRYQIERPLGEGGMGTVFLARHHLTGREVALKWVETSDSGMRERILREARAMGRLTHPNVVSVLDAGEHGSAVFVVMDYVHGQSLRAHAGVGPLSPERALRLLLPAFAGVAAAHQAGILHRDLKPENLFVCLDADGTAFDTKVLDFGVAKAIDDGADETSLTREGTIVGTPKYMAPEQIQPGAQLDGRTDVYALGLVLYELLAGRLPYQSSELRPMLLDILRGDFAPPSRFQSALPAELCKAIMKALAASASERWQDVSSFAKALQPWAGGYEYQAPRKTRSVDQPAAVPDMQPVVAKSGTTRMGGAAATTPGGGKRARVAAPADFDATVDAPGRTQPKQNDSGVVISGRAQLQSSVRLPRSNVGVKLGIALGIVALGLVTWIAWALQRPEKHPDANAPASVTTTKSSASVAAAEAATHPQPAPVVAPVPPPIQRAMPSMTITLDSKVVPAQQRTSAPKAPPRAAPSPKPAGPSVRTTPAAKPVQGRSGVYRAEDF